MISYSELYPEELQLKKENDGTTHATFYDLEIKIVNNKFVYHLFDKRDSFNFYIVRFPYKSSNIPCKIFMSTIGAETLRICKASSTFFHFIRCCAPFYRRMCKQGASIHDVKAVFHKFFFGPTPTGRIRTYKFALVSVCLSSLSPCARFSPKPRIVIF